jgi:hypothetical protein
MIAGLLGSSFPHEVDGCTTPLGALDRPTTACVKTLGGELRERQERSKECPYHEFQNALVVMF